MTKPRRLLLRWKLAEARERECCSSGIGLDWEAGGCGGMPRGSCQEGWMCCVLAEIVKKETYKGVPGARSALHQQIWVNVSSEALTKLLAQLVKCKETRKQIAGIKDADAHLGTRAAEDNEKFCSYDKDLYVLDFPSSPDRFLLETPLPYIHPDWREAMEAPT
ncbi:unnamed protein product [Lampetra fluviatilis]